MDQVLKKLVMGQPTYNAYWGIWLFSNDKTLEKTEKKLTSKEKEILRGSVVILSNLMLFHDRVRKARSKEEKELHCDYIYEKLQTVIRIIWIKEVPSWVCIYLYEWYIQPRFRSHPCIYRKANPETSTPKYVIPFYDVFNMISNPLNRFSKDFSVPYRDLIDESWEKWLAIVWRDDMNRKMDQLMIRQVGWPVINDLIVDICLAMAPLDLPAYVLLEILNYVPFIGDHKHSLKIYRIIAIKTSIEKVRKQDKSLICFGAKVTSVKLGFNLVWRILIQSFDGIIIFWV